MTNYEWRMTNDGGEQLVNLPISKCDNGNDGASNWSICQLVNVTMGMTNYEWRMTNDN